MKTKKILMMAGIAGALGFCMQSCEDPAKPTGITIDKTEKTSEGIPDYADDYSSISSWSNHMQWNLANVHDPSIAYYDGYYYMYNTDASYGNEHLKATTGKHFPGKRSKDLVNWTYIPGPMNDAPSWVADSLNAIRGRMGLSAIDASSIEYGYWAPVVRTVTVDGTTKLRMYYCIVINNLIKTGGTSYDGSWGERAFIGMCESTDPDNGVWEDKGYVVCSSSDKGRDGWTRSSESDWDAYFYYNAIDPTYIVSGNSHYLIYGSWHSGFALLEIDPSSGKPVNSLGDPWADSVEDLTSRYGVRVGTRNASSRWQASEAPEVIYKGGYYYLFMAYDALDVPYNTRVVRSSNIEGPYTDITGRNFTNGRGDCFPIVTHPYKFTDGGYGWVGISHCCIFQAEGTSDWFYCSQGRLPAGAGGNTYANAIMMGHVRRIVWCPSSADDKSDLWPIALPERYAGLDRVKISASDLVGTWQHINLGYSYGNMDTAEDLTLLSDGTMSGALNGTWSFDASNNWLTLSDKATGYDVVVCVENEANWESDPRVETLVYAGTHKDLNATWWGKKVN